jgi:chromosome partitioning protein
MSKLIAILNQKGGCGKTTIAMNLAASFTVLGHSSVVLDADPQQSATLWAQQSNTLPFKVHAIDMETGARKVKSSIQTLTGNVDIAILDLPPELKEPAMLACILADIVIIPVKPSPLDLWAGRAAVELAKDAQELRHQNQPAMVLLPSCVKTGTRMAKDINTALSKIGEQIAPVHITERVALAECAMLGETIYSYDHDNPACQEFTELAQFIAKSWE